MTWTKANSIQTGDVITFSEPVFNGKRWPYARCLGYRRIVARITHVTRLGYGFEVLESSGLASLPVGSQHNRRGRNILRDSLKLTSAN